MRKGSLCMIKKINISYWKKYAIFVICLLLAYIQFMNPYITCDHIGQALFQTKAEFPGKEQIIACFSGGRYGNILFYICYYVLGIFNVSHYQNMYVLQILGILINGFSCMILYNLFEGFFAEKYYKNGLIAVILICFINPFMVETYLYGSFDWAVGILFAIMAVKFLIQKNFFGGFLMAFLAVSIYQTNIFISIVILLMKLFFQDRSYKKIKFYLDALLSGGICVGSAVLNVIIFKMFAKAGGEINEAKNPHVVGNYLNLLKDIVDQAKSVYVSMFSIYPLRFVPVFIAVICICIAIFLVIRKKIYEAILWIALTIILFLTPFSYMLAAGNTWYAQRTLLSVFFSVGMFFIGCLYLSKENYGFRKIFGVAIGFFLFLTFYYTETLITDCYIGQALDYNEVICIEDEIQEYEEKTGFQVDTVSWYKTKDMEYVHPLLKIQDGNICSHRIICDAGDYLLNYVNQKNYKLLWMTDEEYKKYFNDQEWDVFNPSEQLHFEKNILYWAVY